MRLSNIQRRSPLCSIPPLFTGCFHLWIVKRRRIALEHRTKQNKSRNRERMEYTHSSHAVLQETAHDASGQKLHAVHKGYYWDPFVHIFTRDVTTMNSPMMNHGQWLRVKSVEYTVSQFAAKHAPNPVQIVSVGAGMDTLFFRWAASGGKLDPVETPVTNISKYLELDLDELVLHKQHRIANSKTIQRVFNPPPEEQDHPEGFDLAACSNTSATFIKAGIPPPVFTEPSVPNAADIYSLKGVDLADIETVKPVLEKELDKNKPTLILAEFVFVYFRAEVSSGLLKYMTHTFFEGNDNVALYSFDAIQPSDRFGQVMIENLKESRSIILAGIHDLPTVRSHQDRLLSVGFLSAHAMTMGQLNRTVPRPLLQTLNKIEMVDDWDEWEVVMSHYCVCVASKNASHDTLPKIFEAPHAPVPVLRPPPPKA